MKKLLLSTTLITLLGLTATNAIAGGKHHQYTNHYDDRAKVIFVDPIYETIEVSSPRERCQKRRKITITFHSDNRRDEYRNKHSRRCHTEQRYHREERLTGYRVEYKYKGQRFTTKMAHRPGKYIPIEVSIRPSRKYY